MKKSLKTVILVIMVCALCLPYLTFCAEIPSVYVTVANGDIVASYVKVEYKDADGDGKITINDALILVHDEKYNGGSEKGYASEQTQYGLSLTKLWGSDDPCGYYLNNEAVMTSLEQEIKAGDHIYAFVYQDAYFSDLYTFFDKCEVQTEKGEDVTLTLKYYSYAADWSLVSNALSGAVITVDGKETAYTTDENGNVTFKIDKKGEHIISAKVKDGSVVAVPPICLMYVD